MPVHTAKMTVVLAFELLVPIAAVRAQTDEQQVVRENIEIREVGVVADVERSLRGLSATELADRLIVLEDGVARTVTSVSALEVAGIAAYSRVVVAFDSTHCDDSILKAGAAAVGSEAARLVRLGPVEVVRAGDRSERMLEATRDESSVAKAAAAVSRAERCPSATAAAGTVPPGLALGRCEKVPCLVVWVGAGWGEDAPAVAAAAPALEERVRTLAIDGWVVLSAPIAKNDREKSGPTIRPPDHQPGTDRYTFGASVLGSKKTEKLSPEEFGRYVEIWLAPLRRLSAATAGELATNDAELAAGLEALARRSIVWYRAERLKGAPPPRFEVREARRDGLRLRAPEWAQDLR